MRDDFSLRTKDYLAARTAHRCSNPDCRATTTGPHSDDSKAISVGVAAHISAASPGGPRYDANLSPVQRSSATNGIWLCQTCAKLIDSDDVRFTVALLRQWKATAEIEAMRKLGKAQRPLQQPGYVERQKIRDLELRDRMRRQLIGPYTPRKLPRELFTSQRIIVRLLDDETYPMTEPDPPGISPWFRVNLYDFYHNGVKVILWLYAGFMNEDGKWAVADPGREEDVEMPGFRKIKIWHVGKIPFRNIRIFDPEGDEYYGEPHLYCLFADNGEPYEGFEYRLCQQEFEPTLAIEDRIEPAYRAQEVIRRDEDNTGAERGIP